MNDAAAPPAIAARRPGHAAQPRVLAGVGAIIAAIGATAVTGCSAASAPPASPKFAAAPTATAIPVSDAGSTAPSSAATSAAAATGPASALATPPAGSAAAASPASAGSSPAVPVLGRLAGLFAQGAGFGQVKPAKIFNGGDPTGLVTKLAWSSWGAAKATGSGMSDYVGPGQSVATGTQQPVTVVAFDLGICHGTLMYRAVEWYFPGQSQVFSPSQYENICAGHYVPNP
jgi:hypothetical protein